MRESTYNWQQKGWPKFTFNRALIADELKAFAKAFRDAKAALRPAQDPEVVARALADEAVVTSRIEGVTVDESVVLSSICRALGVPCAPSGFTKDVRAEGVAEMMLTVRECWDRPVTEALLRRFHKSLLKGSEGQLAVGAFRTHREPMRVIRRLADATRELAELERTGAVVATGAGPQTRYRLNVDLGEPIEGINEGINEKILRLIKTHPGTRVPYLHSVVTVSLAMVERVLAALVAEGKVEHRGSKKTGGYFVK